MVSLSNSERKILPGIIKAKLCCRSDHAFYFWVENACMNESEKAQNSAREKNLCILQNAAEVGSSCRNFYDMTWYGMKHKGLEIKYILDLNSSLHQLEWLFVVLEKCHD